MSYQGQDGQWYDDNGQLIEQAPGGAVQTIDDPPAHAATANTPAVQGDAAPPVNPAAAPPPGQQQWSDQTISASPVDQIQGLYNKYYGHDADPTALYYAQGNPGGLSAVEAMMQADPAAQAYLASQKPAATPPPPAATTTTTQDNPAFSNLSNSPLLQPWVVPFSQPGFTSTPFTPNETYKPLTLSDFYNNDPGYQARLNAQQQTMERGAAARGTLLNGGTVADEIKAGQDYASNEFGAANNRNVNNFQTLYNSDLSNWSTNYNRSLTDWTTNYNKSLGEYQQAYNIFSNNQANQFNRLAAISGVGQTSAGQLSSAGLNNAALTSNTLMNGANSIGDLYTQAGNATAAGQVGSANAYANAYGNIANNFSNLYKSSYAGLQ